MFGYSPIGAEPIGSNTDALTPEPPEQNTTTIDAIKVPFERRVVFEGSNRVVSFSGSIHKVIF